MAVTHGGQKAVSQIRPSLRLPRLLHPVDPVEFKRDYWEKKPLIVHREDPHYYTDPLTFHDVDQILSTSSVRSSELKVVVNGREIPLQEMTASGPGGPANGLEVLYDLYRKGSTVVFKFLHERWEPLGRLCRTLAAEFSAAFQANAYLTPAAAQGLTSHYDTHDVFVLQIWGSKHWRLYDSPAELPLQSQPFRRTKEGPGNPVREFTLNAGDMMYLPRGTVHDATAQDQASLHVTLGVQPVLWATVLKDALDRAIESDPRYRSSLPPGFALDPELRAGTVDRLGELLASVGSAVRPGDLIDRAVSRANARRPPVLGGHLLDLEGLRTLAADTRVRRRTELLWELSTDAHDTAKPLLTLEFHGKVLRLPARIAQELRFVLDADAPFAARDIPGELGIEGKLVLVRRLMQEGLLTLA
ncbi:cupin (plasmid) [Streptomyces clavuligerus]|uniref:Cupin 4 family protein n=1 Tax=Streptomyces clavuligerus TaxID=1901 RepID=D5SL42_STRCL|nr:cupin [Streptomyces clavuligerus]AXU16986.1 cupin [Streptomyces clavuligerus]EFG04635.1 Cupin 4 family protein [Streptomyces clavuligerus]QCS10491.1 cupin [Streptomyces clavuligerus]QPJ97468.1 cupin [Streptomyces clavuligerus]